MVPKTKPRAKEVRTEEKILQVAGHSFGTAGYEATSLDEIAKELSVTKQTILYHFGSKEDLLAAVIDDSVAQLAATLDQAARMGEGLDSVRTIVKAVFHMATRRPEVLGILREVMRLGEPWIKQVREGLEPLVQRAQDFLEAEMEAGRIRKCNVRLLLIAAYSTVMGVATEIEVLRAMGVEPTLKETVVRRRELLDFLNSALIQD